MYPDEIDVNFLKNFRKFILKWIRRGKKFVIVTGGGSVCRKYQKSASAIVDLPDEDIDWIGIHATRLNAQLLRTIFWRDANPIVCDSSGKIKNLKYSITIASGWRPGWSTDYIAIELARQFKINEVVIAGSPAFVFDKDPKIHKSAKPFDEISWKSYRNLIPSAWVPGFHSPVDPVGARLADRSGIKAIILKGTNLDNFDRLLSNKDFEGTLIS